MPRNPCGCRGEYCETCRAHTEFEMDQEFGGGIRSGNTRHERHINRLHFEHGEEMCRELGDGGTTREQRAARHQPMTDAIYIDRR